MPEQQGGTATERLADIIHAVLLARQTGTLFAERGGGESREEGRITFANGQVVEASIRGQSGVEALSVLRSWRSCRFRFIHQPLSEVMPDAATNQRRATFGERLTGIVKHINPLHLIQPSHSSGSESGSQPLPVNQDFSQSSPRRGDTNPHHFMSSDTGPQRIVGPDTGPHHFQGSDTGPHHVQHPDTGPHQLNGQMSPSPRARRVPTRLVDGNVLPVMDRLGLTRTHRHIFLLIDGQRSIYDLAWLTKHTPDEIQLLLSDLEKAGLIRL